MREQRLEGLVLSSRPLGEHDRLVTLLEAQEGLARLAVPRARRPGHPLAAMIPLTRVSLLVGGGGSLRRVRQLRLLHSYGLLGERLETLAAAQGLMELCLRMVPEAAPAPGMLGDLLLQLGRLEEMVRQHEDRREALGIAVQGTVHLLALGGFALPLQRCVRSGRPLDPPLGDWNWRCSLLPAEGLAIGRPPGAGVALNASELALLQRLPRPMPPRDREGRLLGPEGVWLHLLKLTELWCREHLGHSPRAFRLLRWDFERMPSDRSSAPPPPG